MKHIKTYEEIDNTYKVGDYIYYLSHKAYGAEHEPYAKILNHNSQLKIFLIEHYNKKNVFSKTWLDPDYFVRLLTPKEIEEYEINKNMKKYNI